jgi:aminoglycoside/choline kinase family phosphotransferase
MTDPSSKHAAAAAPPAHSSVPADARQQLVARWLEAAPGGLRFDLASLRPASADASFRRYFRVGIEAPAPATGIVMDAPPEHEDTARFVRIASMLGAGGVSAPRVLAWDEPQGLMLLSDLGSETYLDALRRARDAADGREVDALMRDALAALVRLQKIAPEGLPVYDAPRLRAEMELFPTWYVERHLGATLTPEEATALQRIFDLLQDSALAQPQVLVHRDYHSRNLMRLAPGQEAGNPGVLDFQDAVCGPITYDLVSLLRDAYIDWSEELQLDWAIRYWEQARAAGLPVRADFAEFYREFEWMGLQRQLKVLGIFARLHHRDAKPQYLDDIPLVLAHARAVAGRYVALAPLRRLFDRLQGVAAQAAYTF